jgi:MFS family permease
MYGKLYTFYPVKWVYLMALLLFEIGSFVSGITPTSAGLIIGRAVAGLGAGGLLSGSVIILTTIVPLKKLPAFTGGVFSVYGIASAAGPL